MRKILNVTLSTLFVFGCSSMDPASYTIEEQDTQTVAITDECKGHYESEEMLDIAVVEFVNRTTFNNNISSYSAQRSRTSGAVAVVRPNVVGAVAASAGSFESISRTISPQLGEYAQSAVESKLVKTGGASVVARSQMEQILNEQTFQMSLADPDSAVEFGRLLGAKYIITGSVDNLRISYQKASDTDLGNANPWLTIGAAVFDSVVNMKAGWNVEAELTINIIDVTTGKIVATSKERGVSNIGDVPAFNTDMIIAAAKTAIGEAVDSSGKVFADEFSVKGYIEELRGNKKAALVNIGKSDGVREKDIFQVYAPSVSRDFKTGRSVCRLLPIANMTALKYIDDHSAWFSIDTSDKNKLEQIKIGSIVKRLQSKQ